MISQPIRNGMVRTPESPSGPVWKPDLYKLQQEAPKPKAILCTKDVNRPLHYGAEFHGKLSHREASALLKEDGNFLVRLSGSEEDPICTLSIRFREIKHYRLYYDGQHYVGDKKFDSVTNLVRDGLVTHHLEAEAGPYIQLMCDVVKYEKSPAYLTLSRYKRRTQPLKSASEEECVHYDKPHNFKTHNFKGLNWCEFCSNFLWGFSAQGVKCEDCGFSAHHKCSEKLPPDCCPELKSSRSVFGVDLTTLVRARKTTRPFVVDKCVSEIEARGLSVEGIYRISGFADEMDALRISLEEELQSVKSKRDMDEIGGSGPARERRLKKYGLVLQQRSSQVQTQCNNQVIIKEGTSPPSDRTSQLRTSVINSASPSSRPEQTAAVPSQLKISVKASATTSILVSPEHHLSFSDGENADISENVYDNINVVAGILKQYFRLLPIPLLTYEVHPPLIRAVQLGTVREQIRATKDALSLLPPAHYNTLKFLMAHLSKVDELQSVNKMSAFNLSTVFAPTLMPPPLEESGGGIPDMSGEIKSLSLLIQHHLTIFS